VGEFPEAAKESCEDITPAVAKGALESWIWEKAKVGFAPTAVSLLSKVSTVAFSLARLLDGQIAITLDTVTRISQFDPILNGTEVL
jgi:hypothetical protein